MHALSSVTMGSLPRRQEPIDRVSFQSIADPVQSLYAGSVGRASEDGTGKVPPSMLFNALPSSAAQRNLGFSFENTARNAHLQQRGFEPKKAMKTGTTIVGCVFEGGVVLGADTRATSGDIVSDKNCEKIHYIAPNVRCCGAGTAADTEKLTELISARMTLERFNSGKQTRVGAVMRALSQHLYQYQGHISAALVLGGCDVHGPFLGTIAPHGSVDRLPYVAMGSGSLAAMAVLEARYKDHLTEADAKQIVHDAIWSGIFNDLGSGSNIDLCVIRAKEVEMLRNYNKPNEKTYQRKDPIQLPPGSTFVLRENIRSLIVDETVTPIIASSAPIAKVEPKATTD